MPKPRTEGSDAVKTTIKLPAELWEKAKVRAIEDRTDLRTIVVAALGAYLKKGGSR